MIDVTLQQLRMLREVAARSTIASAAESMGYTPSAVSQQLAGLEKATGVAVLERVGRNVRLTDAGRELVRHADGLMAGMEAARVALERVNNEVRGTLEMAVYESVATTLVPPMLVRLHDIYPDLHVRTRQADPDVAIESLVTGEIDLAFTVDYPHTPAAPRADIMRDKLLVDHFRAVVPADDALVGPVIRLADLRDRPFISSPGTMSCGRCVLMACREAGFEPDVAHQLDDYPTTLHLVAAGQGVALISDLGLVGIGDRVRVLHLDQPLTRTIELAYRRASAERPAIVAVRDTLRRIVAEQFQLSR